MLDLAICIGRFQPPHRAHLEALRLALSQADRVAVVSGNPDCSACRTSA